MNDIVNDVLRETGSIGGDGTPLSAPGTPLLQRAGSPAVWRERTPPGAGAGVSGRVSRQSDVFSAPSDRAPSFGTTLVSPTGAPGFAPFVGGSAVGGTENVIERCIILSELSLKLLSNPLCRVMTPRPMVDLVDIEQDLFDIPRRVRL